MSNHESLGAQDRGGRAPSAPPPANAPTGDPLFEALWNRVLDAWDDPKTHDAILGHALHHELLPDLAGRYRALTEDPDRAVLAKKRVDAVVFTATQLLFATKTERTLKMPWQVTAIAAAVSIGLLLWIAKLVLGH